MDEMKVTLVLREVLELLKAERDHMEFDYIDLKNNMERFGTERSERILKRRKARIDKYDQRIENIRKVMTEEL